MGKGEILCDGDALAGVNEARGARGGGDTDGGGMGVDGAAVAAASAVVSLTEGEMC